MDYQDLADKIPEFVSVAGAIGIALLFPLFLSQRRDIHRLRAFMEREPGFAGESVAASEATLDRTEVELEQLTGEMPVVTPEEVEAGTGEDEVRAGATPASALPAAARVTSERPALERVTMERAALQPHPRWRRFIAAVTKPRVLVVIGIAALLLAVGGIFLSERILDDDGGGNDRSPKAEKVVPAEVTVAVLNGTSEAGLGGKVADDVASNGYALGTLGGTNGQFSQTLVMFDNGASKEATKVAADLGIEPGRIEELDRETELLAGDADVVVIVGEDRAKP